MKDWNWRLTLPNIAQHCGIWALIFALFIGSCGESVSGVENRKVCQQFNDSLFRQLNQTRALYVYSMEEISERKERMDVRLKALKFVQAADLSESDQENASLYNSIFRIYRDLSERYSQAVLRSEEQFYTLKGLSKAIQSGQYDQDRSEYRKEALKLEKALRENEAEAIDITQRLRAVEPNYHRLEEPMQELADRLSLDANSSAGKSN
jgi:hypothetical protein